MGDGNAFPEQNGRNVQGPLQEGPDRAEFSSNRASLIVSGHRSQVCPDPQMIDLRDAYLPILIEKFVVLLQVFGEHLQIADIARPCMFRGALLVDEMIPEPVYVSVQSPLPSGMKETDCREW